ncbi:SpoIIE family protein phosphatase [Kitasatospora sp. NPDC088346]|uniref:SpoIIE family protein phosphatase n=1 Tax=Kitasatospora sp. NPDC088346 TaxID=3364073 RepID=UPI0037FFE926
MHTSHPSGEQQPHPAWPAGEAPAADGPATADAAAAPDAAEGADAFPAGGVVGRLASTVERLRREVQEAHARSDGRALIDLARGILVERLGCGPSEAARQLDSLATQAASSPLELAADIVNQASRDQLADLVKDFVTARATVRPQPDLAVRLRSAESGALADGDVQRAAQSLLEHALAPLGASAVAIWAAHADGSLTLAGAAGFTAEETARWHHVPPGVLTPARGALAERGTARYQDLSEAGPPSIGRHEVPGGRVAVVSGIGGRVIGVLEICWPGPLPPQPPQIQRQLEALAELCAHPLESQPGFADAAPSGPDPDTRLAELRDLVDGLLDPALLLQPHLAADGTVTDYLISHANPHFVDFAGRPRGTVVGALLLEAYPLAAAPGGLYEKVERVHATGESFRTAGMPLTALVDDVPLTAVAQVGISRHADRVVLVWRIQDEAQRVASLLQHAQRLGRIGGFEENLRSGEITWNDTLFDLHGVPRTAAPIPLTQLADHAHPDDETGIGRFLRALLHHQRPASTSFRLQRPDGIARHIRVVAEPVLGHNSAITAVRGAYQDVSAQHWTEVALAATRDQLAHSEQQAAERNRLTLQLQHAIMPPSRGPLDLGALRIAVRYRPAEKDHMVGGDWYDTVVLPTKQVLLCVGDVAGHGIDAATGMVALRNALRGLAATGAGPAQLLAWLNAVAHHLTDNVTATAICALFDPGTRMLRWARAGHLPPVLVRGGEASTVPTVSGILLGAIAEADYAEGELQLETGDTLLLYTDGLIERKDRSLQDSLHQLLTTVRRPDRSGDPDDLESRLDHLLTYSSADTDDDTCLIGIHLR